MPRAVLLLLTLVTLAFPAAAAAGGFDRGAVRIDLGVARGRAFDRDYTIYGLGAGYYVADGIEVGLDYSAWRGDGPDIDQYSPGIRLVLQAGGMRPYLGAFYRATRVDGVADTDAWGGRAGFYVAAGRGAHWGVGVAYLRYLDCDEAVHGSCSETYPEFSLVFHL